MTLADARTDSLSYTTHESTNVSPLDASNIAAAARDDGHAKILAFAANAIPRLEKWFEWLQSTQRGAAPASFRWRGRTANHTLSSGLDDYPRAPTPTDDEIHVVRTEQCNVGSLISNYHAGPAVLDGALREAPIAHCTAAKRA